VHCTGAIRTQKFDHTRGAQWIGLGCIILGKVGASERKESCWGKRYTFSDFDEKNRYKWENL